jgi:hypothetical protein
MVSYPFSLFASALLLVKKSAPNCCHLPNRSKDPKPSSEHKMYGFLHFFGDRFVEKESGLSTYKPSAEELGD